MSRPIRFYVWHSAKKEWVHGPGPCGGCNILGETVLLGNWCTVPLEELNDLVVLQSTGLNDSKGREIYEGDIIRYYEPRRSSQIHFGGNIPGPEGKYVEPLEPEIETRARVVRFGKGTFTFDSDEDVAHNGFVWPFETHRPAFSERSDLMQAFATRRERDWADGDEEGDLIYLLREYGLADEAALIAHLNTFEVIGNVFESPELVTQS